MSMNGDLPGLSNLCPGTIGSCQYSTLRPDDASTPDDASIFALAEISTVCPDAVFAGAGAPASRTPSQWPTPAPMSNAIATDTGHFIWRFMACLPQHADDSRCRQTENCPWPTPAPHRAPEAALACARPRQRDEPREPGPRSRCRPHSSRVIARPGRLRVAAACAAATAPVAASCAIPRDRSAVPLDAGAACPERASPPA